MIEKESFSNIPPAMQAILHKRFLDNREYWFNFTSSMKWTERQKTVERLLRLQAGDNLIFHGRFDDPELISFFVAVLHNLKRLNRKLNLYIFNENLRTAFDKYLIQDKPEIMNERFVEVLQYHNFYQISLNEADEQIVYDYSGSDNIEEYLTGNTPEEEPSSQRRRSEVFSRDNVVIRMYGNSHLKTAHV